MIRSASPARSLLLPAALLCACGGGGGQTDGRSQPVELTSPAGPGSGEPFLATDQGGRVYLSWLEPDSAGAHLLLLSVLEGGAWSEPRTVARSDSFFVNWADFPSVLPLPDGGLAAHWLERSGSGTYAYDVRLVHSRDGGRSWSPSLVPHRDGTQTEHGFVTLFPDRGGSLGLVWLDGRDYAEAEPGTAEMTLRHAVIALQPDGRARASGDDDASRDVAGWGGVLEEHLLDPRVCDCCQTAVALAESGPVVFYRNRSADEIRDIHVIRRADGSWSGSVALHDDGWRIDACPVNGPAAAASGPRVAAAWFTAADDDPRVQVAFSDDSGASFGEPIRVDEETPEGRVDLELLPDGSAAVVWLERGPDGARVRVRRVRPDGTLGSSRVVARSSAARASGFPRVALAEGRLLFAWTQPGGESSTVRVAWLPVEAL